VTAASGDSGYSFLSGHDVIGGGDRANQGQLSMIIKNQAKDLSVLDFLVALVGLVLAEYVVHHGRAAADGGHDAEHRRGTPGTRRTQPRPGFASAGQLAA
jgi:hypothetical protein